MGVVVSQALGYGLILDLNFFLRNLSVVGGLLMVLSDSWVRKRFAPAGLPQIDEKDRKMYVQLAGRILLIFLFIGFVAYGEWSFWRVLVSLFGFVACVMVVVGFKAKFSAVLLVVILSIFNVLVNNWWTVSMKAILCLSGTGANDLIFPASPTTSQQRLCQVRLFPNSVHCWRSVATRQHGAWTILSGREEKGLLKKKPSKHHHETDMTIEQFQGMTLSQTQVEDSSQYELEKSKAWVRRKMRFGVLRVSKQYLLRLGCFFTLSFPCFLR
jgi:uncharacterized membrane protein YphA (DoxX/SURF4 family)